MFTWIKKIYCASLEVPRESTLTTATNGSAPQSNLSAASSSFQGRGDMYLEEGKLQDAAECYRQAVLINPNNVEAFCSLGMIFLQQGLYEDAEHYLKQAISANPKIAQAYYFLGSAAQKQEKLDEAVENFNKARELKPDAEIIYCDLCYTLVQLGQYDAARNTIMQGLAVNPDFADFHFFLGNLNAHEKEFDKAIACYQKVLLIQPDSALAHLNLGKILYEQGRLDDAMACFSNAHEFKTDYANAHFYLGEAFQKQGSLDKAIDCYRKAIDLKPDYVEAYNNLGGLFKDQGKADEAIACYQKALTIKPDSAEIYYNFGLVLKAYGNYSEAIAYYQKAVELKPDFAYAHYNLGNAFFEQGKLSEAIACYRKTLEIKPDFANAYYGLGTTLVAQQKNPEAVACFRRTLELEPCHFSAKTLMLFQLQQMCEWESLLANVKAVRQAVLETPATGKNMLSPLAFLSIQGATAEEQKRCAERWVKGEFEALVSLRHKLNFEFKRAPHAKIRLGYLSGDFHQHPVSYLMAEAFELHDRSRFHITAYSYGPDDESAMRERLENAFDQFVDIRDDSHESAAKRIYSDQIDILVDIAGHTQNSRSGILALRPAPIQVNYLGYPGTMGADFVDYIIADRFTIPPESRQHYTEKVVWMPDCFQANDSTRPRPAAPSRVDCGLPENSFVFCCFNQAFKITPDVFDVWCRLLRAVPDSILWLPASNPHIEANLRREAGNRGVEMERMVMAPLLRRDDHLARLQCANLFLDTLPFNAGTTCSDALWMGLPVVTCAGDAFASRMAGSLLTAIGVPELITYNLEDYYHLALDLATDKKKLEAIHSKILANRDTAPLFDSKLFTRNLEKAYIQMMADSSEKIITPTPTSKHVYLA